MMIHQPAEPAVAVTVIVTLICLAFCAYVYWSELGPRARRKATGGPPPNRR